MIWKHWTFDSGLEIPVIFEVVEDCIQDIVFGENIVYHVYTTQARLIGTSLVEDSSWALATFTFVYKWQNKLQTIRKGPSKSLRNMLLWLTCLTQCRRECRPWTEDPWDYEARRVARKAPAESMEIPLRL